MIILASKSPRRKELLSLITDDFTVDSAEVDETLPCDIEPDKAVEYLSKIKAQPFRESGKIVIGADTVVAIDGKILGKPKNEKDAFLMLKNLSGKEHSVFTGVTVIKNDKEVTFSVQTKVKFLNLMTGKLRIIFQAANRLIRQALTVFKVRGRFLLKKSTAIISMLSVCQSAALQGN